MGCTIRPGRVHSAPPAGRWLGLDVLADNFAVAMLLLGRAGHGDVGACRTPRQSIASVLEVSLLRRGNPASGLVPVAW